MKLKLFAVAAVSLVAALAVAATPRTRAIPHQSPESFDNLIITKPATGQCDWDFPSLNGMPVMGLSCAESKACLATGAAIGDACLAASNFGIDGGSALDITLQLSCRAAADSIVFKMCLRSNDGGTIDLGDAGYFGRAIH